MAELFMECEEEELQPWQRKLKEVVVDDDDDEPIFVGEIVSAKPTSTNNLNRVNPVSSPRGIQNGSPGRGTVATFKSAASSQYKTLPSNAGTMAVTPVFQAASRPATSSVVVQPLARPLSVSGSPQSLQRPIPGGISLQQTSRSSSGIPQPTCRPVTIPVTTQPVSRNANIPVMAQPGPRPVATVTAQPVNQGYILSSPQIVQNNSPGAMFGVQQKEIKQYPSGPTLSLTGNSSMKENVFSSKRPAASEVSIVPPKISKSSEPVMGKNSSTSPSAKFGTTSPSHLSSSKGTSAISNQMKNGAPFPRACPKCNIHFNLMDPLKNHMKYCCPDMVHTFFLGVVTTECSSAPRYEEGKLIMLVSDFYYGKHDGDLELIQQEQKTHTTFKCFSCAKVLKSNVRFMNHMKHHLELEKQNSESWESHTTCHHCYRQFPTPFQLQCHIESSHTLYESTTICKICELSYDNEQVLLQHMKDNHKPGEMPYVCQVCSYRSSLFSDVESHFRTVHENTKSLLCPFCLKVIRIGTPYMQHYMKHQKKGIYRCAKCRLQFLTSKEKMDHRTQHHRTFKKPKQLEGLPPGTKVTIRASVGSLQAESSSSSTENTNPSTFLTSSKTKSANSKNPTPAAKTSTTKSQPSAGQAKSQPSAGQAKSQPSAGQAKSQPSAGQAKSQPSAGQAKSQPSAGQAKSQPSAGQAKSQPSAGQAKSQPSAGQSKKQPSASHSKAQTNPLKKPGVSTSTKKTTIANTALKNLRYNSGANKCIECYSVIKDFASHFPTYNNCSLCRYSTSCSKAYVNHMVSFHSNRPSKRFWIFKKQSKKRRGLTTVCLNCDFLAGDSGLDAMAKHISENHSHSCQIVVENAVEEHLSKSKNETTFGKKQVNSEKHSKPVSFKPENAESVDSSENGSKVNAASLEMRIECNEKEIATDTIEKNEESTAPLKNESDSNVSQKTCSKKQTSEKTSNDADEANNLVVDSQKQQAYDETDVKMHQHLENAVSSDHMKENKIANVDEVDEKKSLKLAPGDVTFEQFLRRDDPESVGSDISDHGSIRLEPLTPSEVLEYEATEILQKGGVSPSTKKAGQTDEFPVGSSPGKAEATISLTDECEAS